MALANCRANANRRVNRRMRRACHLPRCPVSRVGCRNESVPRMLSTAHSRGIRFDIERFSGIQPFQPEAPSKDYGKPAGTHRRITDNKRGITNMAVFMVSERQYMLVYHDPSLNIQMRPATPIDRYPSTATSDQPRTRCTYARKCYSKISPVSLSHPFFPPSFLPWTKGRPREIARRCSTALITRATMFRPRARFFSAFSRHANLRSPATATMSSDAVCFKGARATFDRGDRWTTSPAMDLTT